jgi:hypothetical protein
MKTSSRGELLEEWKMSQKRVEVTKSQYESKLQVRALRVVSDVLKEDEVEESQYEDKLEL